MGNFDKINYIVNIWYY